MKKLRLPLIVAGVLLLATVFLGGYQGQADSAAAGNKATYKSHDAARVKELRAKKVTNKDREAAAEARGRGGRRRSRGYRGRSSRAGWNAQLLRARTQLGIQPAAHGQSHERGDHGGYPQVRR